MLIFPTVSRERKFLIYGAVDSDFGDVVIVAKGPNQDFALDKKERFFGIWLNRKTIHYHNVPRFYHIVSARVVDEFASDSASETYKLSLNSLALNGPVDGVASVEEGLNLRDQVRPEFVKQMKNIGLYAEKPNSLRWLGTRLFSGRVDFPDQCRIGHVYFRDLLFA